MDAKQLIHRKHSLFIQYKSKKADAAVADESSNEFKQLKAEIEVIEKELATIDRDIELLEKYENK